MISRFSGGSGTKDNPWKIATVDELNLVRKYLGEEHKDKCFLLTTDIDLDYWLSINRPDKGWDSFGYEGERKQFFCGQFDGNGNTIYNLWIDGDNMGLFCWLGKEGNISNLKVSLHEKGITGGQSYSAGLVGYSEGVISNCGLSGMMTTNVDGFPTGGLVGRNTGTISDSYVTGHLETYGKGYFNGGLAGENYGTISNCYSHVQMTGNGDGSYIGGLVGMNEGIISCCYTSGETLSNGFNMPTGGLVGWNFGKISNSYTTGKVTATQELGRAGGLVGWNKGNISHCYALGIIRGILPGGLIGGDIDRDKSVLAASYYNKKNTEGIGASSEKEADIHGLELAFFLEKASFKNWSFAASTSQGSSTNPWLIQEGKTAPYLWWQKEMATGICFVNIPPLEGAYTLPEVGEHPVLYDELFTFRVTLEQEYSESNITVRADGNVLPGTNADEIPYSTNYSFNPLTELLAISVEGIVKNGTVGNVSQENLSIKIYSREGQLIIETTDAQIVHIYNHAGKLIMSGTINGQKTFPMQSGVYIVKTSDSEAYKVVVS